MQHHHRLGARLHFRSVYGTVIKEWMGYEDTRAVLQGDFPTLGVFA